MWYVDLWRTVDILKKGCPSNPPHAGPHWRESFARGARVLPLGAAHHAADRGSYLLITPRV